MLAAWISASSPAHAGVVAKHRAASHRDRFIVVLRMTKGLVLHSTLMPVMLHLLWETAQSWKFPAVLGQSLLPRRPASTKHAVGPGLKIGIDVVDIGFDVGIVGETPHDRGSIGFSVAHDVAERGDLRHSIAKD